ncbi:hypothetical protein DB44_GB00010 [Candidatus Protochlamydia amoebophila]|uniref:Uncharacterized protein n=1 Tax=Candidatus Protochlamydia amoebophila TaxID=362787 RepID=A0A0C1JU16_9BACT|nr:hypothetical protein DB44_GB00010 [Candidatus Protochlamydia amoebophila]
MQTNMLYKMFVDIFKKMAVLILKIIGRFELSNLGAYLINLKTQYHIKKMRSTFINEQSREIK